MFEDKKKNTNYPVICADKKSKVEIGGYTLTHETFFIAVYNPYRKPHLPYNL